MLACIWNAISYCAMRVAISGSLAKACCCSFSAPIGVHVSGLLLARHAGWVRQIEHGIALRTQLHALIAAGQKAATPLPRGDRLILAACAQ